MRPDCILDQTPPLARSESLQLWNDLILNTDVVDSTRSWLIVFHWCTEVSL